MKRILFAAACLVLIAVFFFGASYYKTWRAAELDFMAQEHASTFVRPHSPTLGSDDAKVYIVKFTDPACETCASFSPLVKQAMDAFPDRIRFVIRYAPFHEGSDEVVRILEAAKRQGEILEAAKSNAASPVRAARRRAGRASRAAHIRPAWPPPLAYNGVAPAAPANGQR